MIMTSVRELPFTHLRSFEAIARRGSLKEAAAELGVAAGNLSKQLRELESFIGSELIKRSPRGQLTPTGLRLLVQLQEGFSVICSAMDRARADSEGFAPVTFKSRDR